MLAISTSWMDEHLDMEHWLSWIKNLGFNAVELSYSFTEKQLKECELLLREMKIPVCSVHNFCPVPNDGPSGRHSSNYYRLSAVDERERQQAVKWTNLTVDTAEHVGAGVVVIHAGTLDFEDERSPWLFHLYSNGQKDTDAFRQERERILQLREEKRRPYIAALEQSLNEIVVYSRKKNIKIGLETRYYPIEIPNFQEIGYFLGLYDEDELGYWHDVGHAEMNDRLGIRPHMDFLEAYKDRLIGVHLHGIKGKRDHFAPFEGDMDLERFLPYFGPDVLKVVESKPYADASFIQDAVYKLKDF
ncbi:MAG: TIM barrel protein [Candidatus Omnitrophica bacterium]|nr:TIM barrel protein [Candidatus Omnitrophota bacterium]